MSNLKVRTRFAPSPTGYMHIGNLRTALYEYLIAKSNKGDFILRIEDTDQKRYVENAENIIYDTLKKVNLKYDEGPNIGGNYGPYRQSMRKNIYLSYAKKLIDLGKAYYCFCEKQENVSKDYINNVGYDRKCRNLSKTQIEKFLSEGKPYVIRQKMPLDGETSFNDLVYGVVTVQNKELEDQILIKTDGYPTYNFANVIDDHEMCITHVVRGSEYISSTPKYNLLYEAFGWDVPYYIHLPLILGKNSDGSTSKLSKRHGSVSFNDLLNEGYLPEAIINYIALLGWCPTDNREIFSLVELTEEFSIGRIGKSPSIFDYEKLKWFNAEYIKSFSLQDFTELATPYIKKALGTKNLDYQKIASLLQTRISTLSEISSKIDFFDNLLEYPLEYFMNKKSKTTLENSLEILKVAKDKLLQLNIWDNLTIHDMLINLAKELNIKNGTLMWPIRIAISGKLSTPGGAIEILDILGKEESLKRINFAINRLSKAESGNL